MARDRKCILCETVHVSKQEMDEHMRSMLHHRELEKLKGRDCGHDCRVCKVTVVSLTDYASHISSPTHKQNVEAAEQKHAGNDHDENYFDQALVDLIEKRKEQIRKEKEAAAAKLAKEEEDRRRKEEFQQKLKEAKECYRLQCSWQQPSQGFSGSSQHSSWYRSNRYNARSGEARPWHHSKQGKSATWHAQEPPNYQKWASGEFAGGSLYSQEGLGNKQCDQGAFSSNQRSRLPWLSNGGSSNGVYGRNNISQNPQRGRPLSLFGPPPMYPPPPSFFAQALNQFQNTGSDQGGQQGDGLQNGEGQTAEPDHNSSKSSKTFGSNPKLDKACRWSPYPVTKGFESVPHKDTNPNSSEKYPKVPKSQKQDKAPETCAFNRQSRPEQKPGQLTSSGQSVEDKRRHKTNPKTKPRERSSSSSRSNSAQGDGHQNSTSGPSNQNVNKPLLHKDRKKSSVFGLNCGAQLSKDSSHAQSKSTAKQSGFSYQAPPIGPLQSRQERQLPETFKKARQIVLEKRSSLDSSRDHRMEMTLHIVEEQQRDHVQSQIGVNKENSCRQNPAKPNLPDSLRPEKPALQSSDSSQFLQSLQVSTSTMESSEPAASSREDEENRKKGEKVSCPVAPDEAMQAVEAGQSSESDTSRSGEAQTVSGSNTSSLSKLDLPPVLKRDLTKHISSKSKTGSHEPNLNIARRVRNLSESRRSDTEKDSGLKPTVRQLISSSGSRRNVNWEQVYQEVRKKQDKGKGMPRFGIEMVPYEQEDQSQEEDDIPLLEGFQWESLMDISASGVSRKRSLSESSLAPASTHSLFTSLMSKETAQREGHISEQQGSSVSPSPIFAQGNKDSQRQQEVEQILGQFEAKTQKQPDKLTSATVKALQRSDSVLGDSSSGTEQYDGQGTGKRRRAAGDVPSVETSCLEHNNKRRKVKSKKERLQIDQLLAVSLREEELSRSLQTVDTSLIQARATLEAAYMEVQRLMVVKQQMTGEMSTLRNKRIELLKGMQGSMEEAPQVKLKEEKMDSVEAEPHMPFSITLSSVTDTAAAPSPSPLAECASPPSSSLPFMSVVIKQEPQSPVHVSSELDPVDNITHYAHSTTPELPIAPAAASPPDPALNFQPSPERKPELYQTNTEHNWENFGEPADCKESLSGLVETTEKAIQATRNCLTSLPDSKTSVKLLSASRRGSEVGSVVDCAATQSFEPPSVPSVLNLPASPSELRSGKRVRKLKKRKVLKKAQGTEQPESSDTEIDGEALRPRWLRPRRRPSGSSQVSTSTQPSEDREGDMNMEGGEEASRVLNPKIKPEKVEFKLPKNMVELPQVAPAELTVNLDSEESMEVTAACQQPHMDAPIPTPPPVQVPDSSRPEPQSLACNEVTSTSDMDVCKSSESDVQITITLPKITKISSDASSDHGEDDLPTEGVFEGHQEAVNAMQIHSGLLYTCSGDRTVKAFDLVSHKCVGVFEGHSSKVSCLLVSAAPGLHHRLYSGSSDQTIRCYSLRTRELEQQFSLSDRVLCLHSRWKILYAGLANGTVVTFNLKTNKQMDVFECHGPRAVSCLASTQEGARRILLVGSYDSTISVRDAKNGLLLRTLEGHTKTVLCMKVVNDLVFSGSSDQCVYAHNIHTGELVRVYKGHSHAVTVVAVLGKVMVTACLDKLVRVYDLQSHDQLQVYGGHRDMVMCMAVHKNMIYTGCYDGSVQVVKMNLMQNYRCWWHGCSLVFGMMEHLQQHLINDHTSANFQTLKCRWKNCEEFFCARNSSKQGMLVHMQKHAEEETELEP
ncbi:zinc finger protein 106 [Siniperca chuatsi]|uniref:zinc finger protein 106 n=1 Tax=Siniperca chuatsi TaxID=119488 RepID=UPI001CE0A1F6|nr:zinc finger protein 106 [Siniperca chuatsi]XP_044022578.1 zinc finger protein 106 [Siniperca chuatsi]